MKVVRKSQGEEGSYQQNSFPVPLAVPDPVLPKKVWHGTADRLGKVLSGAHMELLRDEAAQRPSCVFTYPRCWGGGMESLCK